MFRASCAHHQEYKILTRRPVQVVVVAGGSSLRHIRDETAAYLVVPDGCIRSVQFSFDILLVVYISCLFGIAKF